MERILVATDGSEGADRAVDFAARMALKYQASLLIINIAGGFGLPGQILRQFTNASGVWLEETLTTLSAETLKAARERAQALGVHNIVLESRGGNIAQAVLDYGDEKNVDAIVIGKRGASHFTAELLGGVTQKLVNLTDRVAIVVP